MAILRKPAKDVLEGEGCRVDINACETPHVPLVVSLAPHRLIPSVGQAELANVGAVHVVVEGDRGDETVLLAAH